MKVDTKLDDQKFIPCTVTIRLESQEELNTFHALMYANISVPNSLEREGYISASQISQLSTMMEEISISLRKNN